MKTGLFAKYLIMCLFSRGDNFFKNQKFGVGALAFCLLCPPLGGGLIIPHTSLEDLPYFCPISKT